MGAAFHFFKAAVQFSITVGGAALVSPISVPMRKRCPSGETSNSREMWNHVIIRVLKSAFGVVNLNSVSPLSTDEDIIEPSAATKKSSLPSRRQIGNQPPVVEMSFSSAPSLPSAVNDWT